MDIRNRFAIIINSVIALNIIIIAMLGIFYGAGDGQLGNYIVGLGYFKPYTMDSNILTGFVALIVVAYKIINLHNDKQSLPRWLMRLYLMGTTSLVLTFLTAAFFLAPIEVISGRSYFVMFSDDMFFFHMLNPLLATFSLIVLMRDYKYSFTDRICGILPTVIYSIVYFAMVVVLGWWDDFYHFTFGGKYYLIPIVILIIYGAAYLCSFLITSIHNHLTITA